MRRCCSCEAETGWQSRGERREECGSWRSEAKRLKKVGDEDDEDGGIVHLLWRSSLGLNVT